MKEGFGATENGSSAVDAMTPAPNRRTRCEGSQSPGALEATVDLGLFATTTCPKVHSLR